MPSDDFHRDLRGIARMLPRQIVGRRTLPLTRALFGLRSRFLSADYVDIIGVNPDVSVRLHRPDNVVEPTPALLWIHGGGYVLGNAQGDDKFCRKISQTLGIAVAAVEYRLAPEHPFPTPLEDCYAALGWLAKQPWADPERLAIGGASAGGGLTAALALLARDRGEINLALQLLVYPMLDDRTASRPGLDDRRHRLWNQRANLFGWESYLGTADRDVAVPARRTDLSGLSPAWLGVGTLDLFYDEDLTYAERLRRAGVPCEVEIVPGAFHGFDLIAPGAPVSFAFHAKQCEVLRAALSPQV